MPMQYKAPPGTKSSIDGAGANQMNTFFYWRKAIIEARKEMFFSPLADVVNMPKNYGKTIKCQVYVPLLDDRNTNDQGLDAAGATYANGNLYGSSKDVGLITSRLPLLSENGGKVNRVGFTRLNREGSITKMGFYTEFTQESFDFDSDADLYSHISREMVTGAVQLTEAILQKDLLNGAGVIVYAGDATIDSEITGEGTISEATYEDLMRLSRILNDNRTPTELAQIKGSTMVDTRTVSKGRALYIGSELEHTVKAMTDLFGNPAFVPVHQYAAGGDTLNGEIGKVDQFRIIVVPEMLHWAGAGAAVGTNPGYEDNGANYNVYPMLCVGEGSFTTIGFQSGGKSHKFKIITKMPGRETADRSDPYGETGFSSIKWYYGTMILRPERLGMIKTVARV